MAESVSTKIAKALQIALADIRLARGYNSDLGLQVHRGFYAHAVQRRGAVFPLVAIQPEAENVDAQTTKRAKISTTSRVVVVTDDAEIPADVLRDCVADVRRALALKMSDALRELEINFDFELGGTEFAIAADSPITLAALTVGCTFIENYEV